MAAAPPPAWRDAGGGGTVGALRLSGRIPPAREGLALLAAVIAGAVGVVALGWHLRIFFGRMGFPLDLEWMEGGTLLHALRVSQGKGIYVPPSVEFIPFLYTPFYPMLLAALGKVLPLGYALGRGLSIASFLGALGALALLTQRQGQGQGQGITGTWHARALALGVGFAGVGAVCAAYAFTGTFYDLVRADSLLLLFEALALAFAYQGRGYRSAAIAGVAIALAFFTKQTASIIGIGIGLGLLIANLRRGLLYGVVAAAVLAAGIALFQVHSDGWFWSYVFKLHQSHSFNSKLAFVDTPQRLVRALWPGLVAMLIPAMTLAVRRQLQRRDAILLLAALAGVLAACVGFGTRWAFENAFVPAVFFPVTAACVLTTRLLVVGAASAADPTPKRRVPLVTGIAATLMLGYQVVHHGRPETARWVPNDDDQAAATRFLEILAAQPGDGFVPFHPYYPVLVGKAPHVHRMGVMDVAESHGRPQGLDAAIAEQKFSFVILDWKSQPGEWPHLDSSYHVVHTFRDGIDAVRSFSGADTSPRYLLKPTRVAAPAPAGARPVADFEAGTWVGWQAEGEAFGSAPAPTQTAGYGRFVADSGRNGLQTTGTLRSAPEKVDRPTLRIFVAGAKDPRLRVFLISGAETVHETSPDGNPGGGFIEWDVSAYMGQQVILVLEDQSPTASMIVDQITFF